MNEWSTYGQLRRFGGLLGPRWENISDKKFFLRVGVVSGHFPFLLPNGGWEGVENYDAKKKKEKQGEGCVGVEMFS